jgi:hypothetical protein
MTAPRACPSCGAPLPTQVRWCLRCFATVRELTPRERQLPPLDRVEDPPAWVPRSPLRDADAAPPTYSRWHAGPTTFGPAGRIAVTVILVVFFPWDAIVSFNPLRLWFMLGYTIFAVFVLRSTWRRGRVLVERRPSESVRTRINTRAGALSRPVNARIVVAAVAIVVVGALAYAWTHADALGRYGMTAVAVVGVVALFLSWWTES